MVSDASVKNGEGAYAWILTDPEEKEKYIVQRRVQQTKEELTSYRVEGCGIRDMTQFLVRNGVPKETLVFLHCNNLSGVRQGSQSKALYQKWVETDDDVYTTIQQDTCSSQWHLHHVKGSYSSDE